jgi:hypothetical protein
MFPDHDLERRSDILCIGLALQNTIYAAFETDAFMGVGSVGKREWVVLLPSGVPLRPFFKLSIPNAATVRRTAQTPGGASLAGRVLGTLYVFGAFARDDNTVPRQCLRRTLNPESSILSRDCANF